MSSVYFSVLKNGYCVHATADENYQEAEKFARGNNCDEIQRCVMDCGDMVRTKTVWKAGR